MPVRRFHATCLAALVVGCAHPQPPPLYKGDLPAVVPGRATIQGAVHDKKTGLRLAGALVIVTCPCLNIPREVMTDARGIYSFVDLPPGKYNVQVLYGHANTNKTVDLAPGRRFIAMFAIAPDERVVLIVE